MATKKTRPAPQSRSKTRVVELPPHLPAAAARTAQAAEAAVVENAPAGSRLPAKKAGPKPARTSLPAAPGRPASGQEAPAPGAAASGQEAPAPGAAASSQEAPAPGRPASGKEAIEAYVVRGAIAAKGIESLGKEVVSFTQASARTRLALAEALMAAKTLQEAIEAQHNFTRESFDNMAAEWAKLTGMTAELTRKLMEPVQAQADTAPWATPWVAPWTVWEPLAA